MLLNYLIAAAPLIDVGVTESINPQLISIVVGAAISSTVVGAAVTGIFQFINNKKNSRVTERKNETDAQSDVILRYKEAAAEEREAKESAMRTMQILKEIADDQIISLKDTVVRLTHTIQVMSHAAGVQKTIIQHLTEDRDRVQRALELAEQRLADQTAKIVQTKKENLKPE
jgi:hypothetical protein